MSVLKQNPYLAQRERPRSKVSEPVSSGSSSLLGPAAVLGGVGVLGAGGILGASLFNDDPGQIVRRRTTRSAPVRDAIVRKVAPTKPASTSTKGYLLSSDIYPQRTHLQQELLDQMQTRRPELVERLSRTSPGSKASISFGRQLSALDRAADLTRSPRFTRSPGRLLKTII